MIENVGMAIELHAQRVEVAAVQLERQLVDLPRVEQQEALQNLGTQQHVEQKGSVGVGASLLGKPDHLREDPRGGEGINNIHRHCRTDRIARRRNLR